MWSEENFLADKTVELEGRSNSMLALGTFI